MEEGFFEWKGIVEIDPFSGDCLFDASNRPYRCDLFHGFGSDGALYLNELICRNGSALLRKNGSASLMNRKRSAAALVITCRDYRRVGRGRARSNSIDICEFVEKKESSECTMV